ncbi:MAG TPA: AmmeMemoRadiSam system protein B [Ramlibacter sp.]|uniref:AmmeMemoRadiSam system protein B n=1 Tax=Ramlibacter sp. TaxID=1917967 RepID=UPI002CD7F891|nr:AmmeMemoRadiSam system protein B [Ramlibacter sp.]HVZ46683.1 AmmeMemoRadiSam system protein B [Ramlibacter sp.]
MEVRPAAVAGMFYPGDPQALRRAVQGYLQAVPRPHEGARWPKAVIVPHAGYVYSGSTAAQAFAQLAPGRGTIRRVVLLGPVHRVPVRGLALPGATAFETPLGTIPLDAEAMRLAARLPQVVLSPGAHAMEHSLEVQLPFLQEVLGDFLLLPLAVGDATPGEAAEVLDELWGADETVIVISSDLSHYHSYAEARGIDDATVRTMLRGTPNLHHEQACGATPVNGLLLAAPRHGLQPRLLKLCNSGDTAGDKSRVVGYASLAFDPREGKRELPRDAGAEVPEDAGATLLPIARSAISQALGRAHAAAEHAAWLGLPGATFVTLKSAAGELRGCIGSLEARRTLLADVKHNAVAAALHDHRFAPLQESELDAIRIEVSLLSVPQPIAFRDEGDAIRQLRRGIDGIVLNAAGRRATFLPQVWEQIAEPAEFLEHLKRKAGLAPRYWDPHIRLERYTVSKWVEVEEARQ